MKRLTLALVTFLTPLVLSTSALAVDRYWDVSMTKPTSNTTSRTLRIGYTVFSTVNTDDFTVKLLQNNAEIASQTVTNDTGGDSGAFTVNIPATGTYTYLVRSTNSGDGSTKDSESSTVKVDEAQAATVVTTTTTDANGGGQGAGGAAPGAAAAAADGGNVNAADDAEGNVNGAATTTNNESGQVQGAETSKSPENSSNMVWLVGIPLAIVAIGGGLYWWRGRQQSTN